VEAAGKPTQNGFIKELADRDKVFPHFKASVEAEFFVPHPDGRGFSIPD